MKVKARQRGAQSSSAQSHQAAQSGQKHTEQTTRENHDSSGASGRGDGSGPSHGGSSGSSSTTSSHTPPKGGSANSTSTVSAPSVLAAAATRPALVIGTTSAAARTPPPSRALTQQQLRRQRQQQRATLPPVRARGTSAITTSRQPRRGAGSNAAASADPWTAATGAGNPSGKTVDSAAALDDAVKAVERALEDGAAGQERLRAMSLEQPDLYSHVILALFKKTHSLELISRMPMPMMPEPDFMLDAPIPGAEFDLDLAWDEGEEGDEMDDWEEMAVTGGLKGGYGGMYDMPYDLDGVDVPFPEAPFPDFDYDPGLDYSDDDDDDDVYEDGLYGDENDGVSGEEAEGYGYLAGPGLASSEGGGYLDVEEKDEGTDVEDVDDETHGTGSHVPSPVGRARRSPCVASSVDRRVGSPRVVHDTGAVPQTGLYDRDETVISDKLRSLRVDQVPSF